MHPTFLKIPEEKVNNVHTLHIAVHPIFSVSIRQTSDGLYGAE